MSRKDYIVIANVLRIQLERIKRVPFNEANPEERRRFDNMVNDMCVELKSNNSAFNVDKFHTAIYGEEYARVVRALKSA